MTAFPEELNPEDEQNGRTRLEQAYANRCRKFSCKLDAIIDNVRQWNGQQPLLTTSHWST